MTAMLHIHNGDSTAGTARQANIPGEHLAWREALVCGPAPENLSEAEFLNIRAQHLAAAYGVDVEKSKAELRAQHDALANFSDHEEVVLWFEHDLFCQVQLIYLLNWFSQRELGNAKLSLICIDKFPGVEDFRGLGQLNEQQLTTLFPMRRKAASAQLNLGSKAWQAYASPAPTEIESLLKSDTGALPFLGAALTKHLQRFPAVRNGLGRVANSSLELIGQGHHEFKTLFPAFGKCEPFYGFGDAQLFLELKRLANATRPVLKMSNGAEASPADAQQLINTSFEITDDGQAVMNGEQDFVQLNRIDFWLGGVHLESEKAAWRWDEENDELTKAP